MNNKKPIIYSTRSCHYCVQLKNWFKENQIEYQDMQIGVDISFDDFSKKTGSMGVPVTEINNQFVIGYNIDAIKQLL